MAAGAFHAEEMSAHAAMTEEPTCVDRQRRGLKLGTPSLPHHEGERCERETGDRAIEHEDFAVGDKDDRKVFEDTSHQSANENYISEVG